MKQPSEFKLGLGKLISLFLVFVLSTSAFLVFIIFFMNNYAGGWIEVIEKALFLFGFIGYIFVILSLLSYYITYYSSKLGNWLKEDRMRLIIAVAILLAFGHSLFMGLGEKSVFTFLGYLAGDGIIIIALPQLEKIFGKMGQKNQKGKNGNKRA